MLTQAPKGTKDLLPREAYKWHFIENAFAEMCARYSFKEIRTPTNRDPLHRTQEHIAD